MGTNASVHDKYTTRKVPFKQAIEDAMPSYYVHDAVISDEESILAHEAWERVISTNTSAPFLMEQSQKGFQYASTLSWFFDVFYNRLFELSPITRPMFANISISAQGRLLAEVISSAIGLVNSEELLRARLMHVILRHNDRGIDASLYGVMGSALIYAFRIVLGAKFNPESERAWIKIYSLLLKVIIPIALAKSYPEDSKPYIHSFCEVNAPIPPPIAISTQDSPSMPISPKNGTTLAPTYSSRADSVDLNSSSYHSAHSGHPLAIKGYSSIGHGGGIGISGTSLGGGTNTTSQEDGKMDGGGERQRSMTSVADHQILGGGDGHSNTNPPPFNLASPKSLSLNYSASQGSTFTQRSTPADVRSRITSEITDETLRMKRYDNQYRHAYQSAI